MQREGDHADDLVKVVVTGVAALAPPQPHPTGEAAKGRPPEPDSRETEEEQQHRSDAEQQPTPGDRVDLVALVEAGPVHAGHLLERPLGVAGVALAGQAAEVDVVGQREGPPEGAGWRFGDVELAQHLAAGGIDGDGPAAVVGDEVGAAIVVGVGAGEVGIELVGGRHRLVQRLALPALHGRCVRVAPELALDLGPVDQQGAGRRLDQQEQAEDQGEPAVQPDGASLDRTSPRRLPRLPARAARCGGARLLCHLGRHEASVFR